MPLQDDCLGHLFTDPIAYCQCRDVDLAFADQAPGEILVAGSDPAASPECAGVPGGAQRVVLWPDALPVPAEGDDVVGGFESTARYEKARPVGIRRQAVQLEPGVAPAVASASPRPAARDKTGYPTAAINCSNALLNRLHLSLATSRF